VKELERKKKTREGGKIIDEEERVREQNFDSEFSSLLPGYKRHLST